MTEYEVILPEREQKSIEMIAYCCRGSAVTLMKHSRAGSQKSPWLISAIDLAQHIDKKRIVAARQWANMK
jgi:hypothetical protein